MESSTNVQCTASEEKSEESSEPVSQSLRIEGLNDDQGENSESPSLTVTGFGNDKRSTTLSTEVATKKACIRTEDDSNDQPIDIASEKADEGLQQVSSSDGMENTDEVNTNGEESKQEEMDINPDNTVPVIKEEPMDASQQDITNLVHSPEIADSEVESSSIIAQPIEPSNDVENVKLLNEEDSKVSEDIISDKSNVEEAKMAVDDTQDQIGMVMEEGDLEAGASSSISHSKTCEAEAHAEALKEGEKPSTSSLTAQEKEDSLSSVYYLKWFQWQGIQTPLVTQNENGPCPLLAIANVLMLSHKIQIPSMQEFITAQQLMEHIGDYILSLTPKENNDEEFILNYEQNMQDAIAIMHKLQTGIDVNVKFTGCKDFEFTSECVVFDLLHIGLYHGWLVDPQDIATLKAIGSLSYNQIVEKIIASKEANAAQDAVAEGVAAEGFLEQTASQLSYHGLCELNTCILPGELCVFFRNNHFSTLYKHNDKLFLLVTDQGYLTEPRIIWETLSNVEGDGDFVNADFKPIGPMQSYGPTPGNETTAGMTQEDRDYLVALSLQEKASETPQIAPTWDLTPEEAMRQEAAEQERKDLMYAMRLQEQERQLVARQQRQQRTPEAHVGSQGRPYGQGAYPDNRVRVGHQSQGISEEDRQQQGKCSIL